MCAPGQLSATATPAARATPARPGTAAEALAALEGALDYLNEANAASWPAAAQASCLKALERAGSKHTAARAAVLAAFTAQDGCQDDGQRSAHGWLTWQTAVTAGAAAGAVGWARRIAAHPAVGQALAAGEISASWAREICRWTDRLPAGKREDADAILLGAAAGGADLASLAGLAEEMHRRSCPPDCDDDGFDDRSLRLDRTFRGAGRVDGDLTPECAAALAAVLEALGQKAGPEDERTKRQRDHDALEEVCTRLIASGWLPERAGQPTRIQLHMTLSQLRGLSASSGIEAAWAGMGSGWGWLTGPGADAAACDAAIIPVVSGHVDYAALAEMTEVFLAAHQIRAGGVTADGVTAGGVTADGAGSPRQPMSPDTLARLGNVLLSRAADLLSGPAGLAALLRRDYLAAGRPFASVSLPLDIGKATEEIPAHLRRAVIQRDRCCGFPGCTQPPVVCQVHHIRPRSKGGRTSLTNTILLCRFHHLIAVHRWGWAITLHPDGTVTATSPDKTRVLHSHGPPARAA
jgi:hypothetical protein